MYIVYTCVSTCIYIYMFLNYKLICIHRYVCMCCRFKYVCMFIACIQAYIWFIIVVYLCVRCRKPGRPRRCCDKKDEKAYDARICSTFSIMLLFSQSCPVWQGCSFGCQMWKLSLMILSSFRLTSSLLTLVTSMLSRLLSFGKLLLIWLIRVMTRCYAAETFCSLFGNW